MKEKKTSKKLSEKLRKKEIIKKQKMKTKENKEPIEELHEMIELPMLDLKKAESCDGERAYAIKVIRNIIDICEDVLSQGGEDSSENKLFDSMNELFNLSICDSWYYYNKVNEINKSEEMERIIHIIKNNSQMYLINKEDYILNPIERALIFMDADILKMRMLMNKNWGAELWLATRCDMQITLFNIINKVEQRWINDVEVDLNEENEVIRVYMKYGEPYRQNGKFDVQMLVYKLFHGQEWLWKKYNNQNQIICSGRDIDDVVDFEKFWKESSIKKNNNQSVRKVEKKKDILDDDYVTLLEKGVELKHLGKYQEAKEMYIKAIHVDNSHPNAYNNLGKILYILGDYEASARAYKAAYERGICELMNSMQIELYRMNYSSFYIHVGHALLDKEYIDSQYSRFIKEYREGIDPTSVKGYIPERGTLRKSAYNEYDKMCIEEAKKYLEV